jgi:two-component system nitrate/nitrite response regulator NarL
VQDIGQIYIATLPINEAKVVAVLTNRERQMMRLVSQGLSNKAMCRRPNIADRTLRGHPHNLLEKTGWNRSTHASVALK